MSPEAVGDIALMVERLGLDIGLVLGIIGITWLVKKNIPTARSWIVFVPLVLGVIAALAATALWVDGKFQVAALTKAIFAYAGGASISYNVWEAVTRRGRNGR